MEVLLIIRATFRTASSVQRNAPRSQRIDIDPFLLENYAGHSASIGGVEQSIGSAMSHELLGHAYPFAFGVDNMNPHRYGWINRGPKQE